MKTKDIYKENKERKYCQIVDIKNENVEVESAPIKVIKENWKKYLAATLIILAIIIFTFYKDLKVLLVPKVKDFTDYVKKYGTLKTLNLIEEWLKIRQIQMTE